jgi:hypothetical protein
MAHAPDATLGAALRIARLVLGLSLPQVASGSGVPEWRLRAFERGVAAPPALEFLQVWKFLTSDDPERARECEAQQ